MSFDLKQLGFSKENLSKLKEWCGRNYGLIILTGPTGSGKTTVFYALLQEFNTEQVKVHTVENPVECQIDGINQIQLVPSQGLTYSRALRSVLRQDPDIIGVGETRDLETAHLLTQAAVTGHLVLTTLPYQDTVEAIRRLLDMGLEPSLVNGSLTGVAAQRLVRTICPACRERYTPESWVKDLVKTGKDTKFYRGKGCKKCSNTGYHGRTAIYELLDVDDRMKGLIARGADLTELRKQAKESGLVTLREDGMAKVRQGITTVEEVLRCASVV
jgi:type IV pilus assembly protein PilB